jgi:hypothetical protein
MWKKPFGLGYKTMTAWDLKKRFEHSSPGKKNTCFRKLVVGIYGPASPLTVASWDTGCKGSPMVKAYSDFVIRGMGLQHLSHYAEPEPSKEIHITFMARRSSSEWPEKRYCDDKNSFFLCEIWKNWGLRSLKRTVRNEDVLLKGLKNLENETFANGAKIKIADLDYNLLSFEDQIKIDLRTDIMVRFFSYSSCCNYFAFLFDKYLCFLLIVFKFVLFLLDRPPWCWAYAFVVYERQSRFSRVVCGRIFCKSPLSQYGILVWPQILRRDRR